MPSRVQVESGLGRVRIQPVASPVDSFEKPVSAQDSQLGQLADALGQVSPEVAAFGIQAAKRQGERDKAAGAQRARELYESGKSYREAIRDGLISPDQSPWFRQGAEEQMGRLAAENYNADMIMKFAQSEYADSYDPNDFNKFALEHMKTWAAENLPDVRTQAFNTGFAQVDDKIAGARENFAKRAGENLIKYNRESFGATVYASLTRITTNHGTMKDMAAGVQKELDLQVAAGLNPRIANDIAAEAIIRMANETLNPAFMDIMKDIKAGPTSLWDRPTVGAMVKEATANINNRRAQEDHAAERRRVEANRLAQNKVFSTAIVALRKNHTINLDPYIEQLTQLDSPASTVAELANLKRTLAGEKFAGDQTTANEMLAHAITVTDQTDPDFVSRTTIARALNRRAINEQDFNNLLSIIERREREADGSGDAILSDPLFTKHLGFLKTQFGGELTIMGEKAKAQFRASAELINDYIHWREGEGANATREQKNAFLTQLVEDKRLKFGGKFADMKDNFSNAVPKATLNTPEAKPEWQRGPVSKITPRDWRGIARAYVQGGMSVDSLSDAQTNLLQDAGATPETLKEFVETQLQFNGFGITQPAAAAPKR